MGHPFAAFGAMLKKRRQAAGYRTQQALADVLKVNRTTVADWESGKHYPTRHIGALEMRLGPLEGEAEPIPAHIRRSLEGLTDAEAAYVVEMLTKRRRDDGPGTA